MSVAYLVIFYLYTQNRLRKSQQNSVPFHCHNISEDSIMHDSTNQRGNEVLY